MRPKILVLTACFSAVAVLHAQDPGSVSSGQTFRSDTRLIQVSVVVHDNRQRPIEGLTAQDFELFEDGKPQRVALFSVIGQSATEPPAASSGVFTNRVRSPAEGGVVAIVFDRLNTAFAHQARARDHILEFLRKIRPEDRVALYVLNPEGMRILHDFTRDSRSLLRALDRVRAGDSAPLEGSESQLQAIEELGGEELSAFARANFQNMKAFYGRVRAYTSIQGLEDVSAHLAGVPGRKNLIWISSGFPFDIVEVSPAGQMVSTMRPETRRATQALNNSDIAVYPVDARGLVGAFKGPAGRGVAQFSDLSSTLGPIEGIRHVADWTGGRAFFNTNDLGDAIRRAMDDSRLTYVLGYYPAEETWDTKFRTIKVKVRRSGVHVRHRSGYYAIPPETHDQKSRQKAVANALDSPLEANGLPLSVSVEPAADGRLLLTVVLDRSVPELKKESGTWTGAIDIAIVQTLASRELVKESDVTLPFSLDDEKRERLVKEGLRVTRTITLHPEAHQVRIVARDVNSGTIGSVIIPASQLRRR